jgi:hypothetical protein
VKKYLAMLLAPGPSIPDGVSSPVAVADEFTRILAGDGFPERHLSLEYRELGRILAAFEGGFPDGRFPEDFPDALLHKVPLHLYGGIGDGYEPATDPAFLEAYASWLEAGHGGAKSYSLRLLWRRLLVECNPGVPMIREWAAVLARAMPDWAPPDLLEARRAIARYHIFDGRGGVASDAVLESFRMRSLFGARAMEGTMRLTRLLPGDHEALAGFVEATGRLAGVSGILGPIDQITAFLNDGEMVCRLIGDDPERGFTVLESALKPLEDGAGGPDGYLRLILPCLSQLFGDPRVSPSCFWPDWGDWRTALCSSSLTAEDLGFFLNLVDEGAEGIGNFWSRRVMDGAVRDSWVAAPFDVAEKAMDKLPPTDLGGGPPQVDGAPQGKLASEGAPLSPGVPVHGLLTGGPVGLSFLFLKLEGALVAQLSSGLALVWPDDAPDRPEFRKAEYVFREIMGTEGLRRIPLSADWERAMGDLLDWLGAPARP